MLTLKNSLNRVKIKASIGGKKVDPRKLSLIQENAEHHHFELTLDYENYAEDFMISPLSKIELMGKAVVFSFSCRWDPLEEYVFKGVITSVKQTAKGGRKGHLILLGSSPTILLEKGKRIEIYSEKTLESIFRQILERANPEYLLHAGEPSHASKVDFLMQYNQTDWEFLKYSCYLYKENLWYSGEKLLFGEHKDNQAVDLTYDKELCELEFSSNIISSCREYYHYQPEQHREVIRELPERSSRKNEYTQAAERASQVLTQENPPRTYLESPIYQFSQICKFLEREKLRISSDRIVIRAKSSSYKPSIGKLIHIYLPENLANSRRGESPISRSIGAFRVTKSIHQLDENQRYSCHFEAVLAGEDVMPFREPKTPVVSSMLGRVKSNEDPLGKGRVQVEFEIARNHNYSWMRVLSPSAGSSPEVSQNRGMAFIPEKGDQVMVGFEHSDPNRPYVMGSLFHGENSQEMGKKNNAEKSLITSSGIKIVFNDAQKSLNIEDPSGNRFHMDGRGSISMFAPKKIKLESQEIEFFASKNLELESGKKMSTKVYGETTLETTKLSQTIRDQYETYAGESLLSTKNQIKIESLETLVVGEKKLLIHSAESTVLNSKGTAEIHAEQGINHTKTALDYQVQLQELKAECMISFRVHSGYNGEFGFDWLRKKDTKLLGDNPFKEIMGKYYESDGKTLTNDYYNGKFKKDRKMYQRKLREYENLIVGWKSTEEEIYLYSAARMTLLVGKTAKLNLHVEVKQMPKEGISFEFEDKKGAEFYELSRKEIQSRELKQGARVLDSYLTITAKKECPVPQTLLAKADGKLCGKLIIYGNHKKFQRAIKVVFVQVKTMINGKDEKKGEPAEGGYEFFKDCLHQALVMPQERCEMVDLDCMSSEDGSKKEFRDKFCSLDDSGDFYLNSNKTVDSDSELEYYLEAKMREKYEDKYEEYYRVYFIGESDTELNGFAHFNSKFGVYFFDHNKATIAHELFHAMGLKHTFDGVSEQAEYTYEACKTDNIMDYSHQKNIPRLSLFAWQWRVLNPGMEQTGVMFSSKMKNMLNNFQEEKEEKEENLSQDLEE